ncbi:MAG: putative LPS assembly protein LptD [Candidatus Cloacimonetes bacterium]|nr:putative LPS assembly protein LptD [Candidatus Cloacimonadota bacterium]
MKKTALLLTLLLALGQITLLAQAETGAEAETAPPDTLATEAAQEDSLFYSADSLAYNHALEQIRLYGNTSIRYQSFVISSDSLRVDLKNNRAFSQGNTVMQDGDQIILGDEVAYDIESQTGTMSGGISRMEKSYYTGEEIRKVSNEAYDVDNGSFTTCENAEPDFWFTAKKLRIYRGDKIVGKPVIAYVNHLPVFYFPFIVVPLQSGRKPGFLIPQPGYNTVDGKFFRDIAWYYPYKDYADLILSMDIYERTGWRAELQLDYLRRYLLNGSLTAAFQRRAGDFQSFNDWSLRATHHQELGNRATFDANVDFLSNKRIWEGSSDIDESLAQTVTSSLSYRQPLLGSYLNVGASYTEDLINDRATVSLPSASFALPTRPVYELFYRPQRSPDAWWSNLNYSYNLRLDHSGSLYSSDRYFMDYIWDNRIEPADSSLAVQHNFGIKHQLGLAYNWKAFGWLGLQHGARYNEAWFDRDKNGKPLVRGNDYSAYTNANFNIYGIRNFNKGWLKSLRHILTPNAGISFNPDFSANSRFYGFGGIGLLSSKRSANLNLSLDQKWQIKFGKEDRKINDVLSLSSRSSANLMDPAARPFENISHTAAFRPGSFSLGSFRLPGTKLRLQGLSLAYSTQYSLSHSPYGISWDDWKISNQYFSQSLSFSGSAPYQDYFVKEKNRIFEPYQAADSLQLLTQTAASAASSNTWRISVSHDLSAAADLFDPGSQNLRLDSSFRITKNWSVSYGSYFNLETGDLLSQTIRVSRDLHCWKLDLSYTRRNDYWEYKVALFNLALPDALRFQTSDSKTF